ncbi:peptidyl-prolyl cis-trans isomerase NIMA-interacting 4-like [Rattus norvegicus]|uniref:peptidyl-prolyl cis-trans isomerase NIMA-interacting 4-like n=1 Tax=Rattus norvegicus TaxID=10116 RepID=UPI002FD7CFB1
MWPKGKSGFGKRGKGGAASGSDSADQKSQDTKPKGGGNAGEIRHMLYGMEKCGMNKPVFINPPVKTKFEYHIMVEGRK